MTDTPSLRVLRLTGEQLASIDPPVSDEWFIDFDEHEDFILAPEAKARSTGTPGLREALAALPLGPYQVEWPEEQGGSFLLWAKQGTPPDFTDGWAIPLVARGTDTCMFALAAILNAFNPDPALQPQEPSRE